MFGKKDEELEIIKFMFGVRSKFQRGVLIFDDEEEDSFRNYQLQEYREYLKRFSKIVPFSEIKKIVDSVSNEVYANAIKEAENYVLKFYDVGEPISNIKLPETDEEKLVFNVAYKYLNIALLSGYEHSEIVDKLKIPFKQTTVDWLIKYLKDAVSYFGLIDYSDLFPNIKSN